MEKEPITIKGLEKLKEELNYLKNVKRHEIISAIAEVQRPGRQNSPLLPSHQSFSVMRHLQR